MAHHLTSEETKIIVVIEKLPFLEEEKKGWVDTLRNSGLNEELIKEVHAKLAALPHEEEANPRQAANILEMNRLINRWRLTSNIRSRRK
jgi:hypothetical protein